MKIIKKIKSIVRNSSKKIKYNSKRTTYVTNPEFEKNIYIKTITQVIKEYAVNEITISCEKSPIIIPLLEDLHQKNITFLLGESEYSHIISDYFLIKSGIPIPVIRKVKSGLYVYLSGPRIPADKTVPTLVLYGDNTEYFIRNVSFPVKINSIAVLKDALSLTEKNISDIIIKPCIIYESDE